LTILKVWWVRDSKSTIQM